MISIPIKKQVRMCKIDQYTKNTTVILPLLLYASNLFAISNWQH